MAIVVGCLASHGYLRWKAGTAPLTSHYRDHLIYRVVVLWALISPLVWTLPGMPDFVTLTLVNNSLQVVIVPFLAGGLWWITASERCIGREYRNVWWENMVMAVLFALAIWGAYSSIISVVAQLTEL